MSDYEQLQLFIGALAIIGSGLTIAFVGVAILAWKYRLPLLGAPPPRPIPRYSLPHNKDSQE